MFEKKAETSVAINDLLARRWSGRAFDPGRRIAQEDLVSLLEAARWAPSCFGDEPWRYVVCEKAADNDAWERALSCLSEGNRSWACNAPLLMLAAADSILSKNGKPNRWGQYDTGAASMSLCVQATELDLMVHQMGGFDVDRARQAFNVPDQFVPMAMIAVGYQLPLDEMSEDLRERETVPRARSPLGEMFFAGEWDRPVC